LIASKPGFLADVNPNSPRMSRALAALGAGILLAAGQSVEVGDIAMTRASAVAGRVTDERGNAITGARVVVYRWRWEGGRRWLAQEATPVIDQTDDLGEFRLFDIPPGTYLVGVSTVNPFGAGAFDAYYPGVYSSSAAEPVVLRAGEERSDLVVTLVRPRLASISGVVRAPGGLPPGTHSVYAALDNSSNAGWVFSAGVRPDGSYALTPMLPGEYVLSLSLLKTSERGPMFASARVTLDGSDLSVSLTLRGANAFKGRYIFEGGTPPSDLRPPTGRMSSIFPMLERDLSLSPAGSWTTNEDWTFEAAGLSGQYRVLPPAPSGWAVKSVRLGDTDVTDAPLDFSANDIEGVEVLLTQRRTRLSGTVKTGSGDSLPVTRVVVFAEDDAKLWPNTRFLRVTRPDASGHFTINDLPPARYLAVAVADLEIGEETNPALLRQLRPSATSVVLEEGESRTVDLQVVDARQ
jgi:hypothetical protein